MAQINTTVGDLEGNATKIHHTFNTQQSMIRDSSHPNHVEPWEVELNDYLGNVSVSLACTAVDPGADDLELVWEFDDGTVVTSSHPNPGGVYPFGVTESLDYSGPASSVTLTVTDDDNNSGDSTFEFVVVYDPSTGFVTGGGWIISPAGAYTDAPSLTGKANFGFVSKYKKGADTPSGETEFQFKVADLNFRSTNYQWLVVAGAHAKYKGEGTINGEGEYGFMLTATDGQINGGGGVDKFRIKIWDKATEDIIYDNQLGDPDDANASQVIGRGSIVIHTGKK